MSKDRLTCQSCGARIVTSNVAVGDLITTGNQVRALRTGTVLRTHDGEEARAEDSGLLGNGWFLRGRALEARYLPARVTGLPEGVAR